jgi:hypothetical protein
MPAELIFGQKPIMPIEESIVSWLALPWQEDISREELLALRIRQLERREDDIEAAKARLKIARLKNKEAFDQRHRLRPRRIMEGDWVLVYDSSLDNQHSTARKFSRRWFGPYVVKKVEDNATYRLTELDGTSLALPIAGKRIKVFKRREVSETQLDALDESALSVEDEDE